MRAKEYAKLYNEAEDKQKVIIEIIIGFKNDLKELLKKRNIKSKEGFSSALLEVDNKFRVFARMFPNEIKENGFTKTHNKFTPEAHMLLK